jgi:hypothetical protein
MLSASHSSRSAFSSSGRKTAYLEGDGVRVNEERMSENILNVRSEIQIQSLPNANHLHGVPGGSSSSGIGVDAKAGISATRRSGFFANRRTLLQLPQA